jgi:hypothetical protein
LKSRTFSHDTNSEYSRRSDGFAFLAEVIRIAFFLRFPIATNHDKRAHLNTDAKENVTLFVFRVFGIRNDASIVGEKSGFGLVKGNTLLPQVF